MLLRGALRFAALRLGQAESDEAIFARNGDCFVALAMTRCRDFSDNPHPYQPSAPSTKPLVFDHLHIRPWNGHFLSIRQNGNKHPRRAFGWNLLQR
jgi:hypothetical protein